MLSNFNAHVASIEAKRATQIDLREKEDSALEDLRRRERNLASTQGGLIANKRVSVVHPEARPS
jgi:DNA repair protein RAD50